MKNIFKYLTLGDRVKESDLRFLEERWKLKFALTQEWADKAELRRISSAVAADLLGMPDDQGLSGILIIRSFPLRYHGCQLKLYIVFDDVEAASRVASWREHKDSVAKRVRNYYGCLFER